MGHTINGKQKLYHFQTAGKLRIFIEVTVNPLMNCKIQHYKRWKLQHSCNLFFRQFIQFVKNAHFI